MTQPVSIHGLREFSRQLRKIDSDLPKALRVAMNSAADVVVGYAKPRVPKRSGRAARSVKARSTRTAVRVQGGSRRVPYYPWLDFGGRVGRRKAVRRAFLKEGRYIYAGYYAGRDEFDQQLEDALIDIAQQAGLEVTRG